MLIPKCALVRAAITHVTKHHRGASLVQVRKHLEVTYDEKLDSRKKKLIHTTFKTLIQKGKLLRKGTIYKATKARAIARVDVPQRRYRRRHRRRRLHHLHHHCRRHHHRKKHHGRHHQRRRHHHKRHHHRRKQHRRHHHKRHHHRRKQHRRHHQRRRHHKRHHSHHGHHHDWHDHCSRHKRRHVNKNHRQYKHHGENVSVEVPMEALALSTTTSKLSQQKKT